MELNELVNISDSISRVNKILDFTINISLSKTKYEYLQQQVYIHIGLVVKVKRFRFDNVIFRS